MINNPLTEDERRALVQNLRDLSLQYTQADYGSDVGGAAKMRKITAEATELLWGHGFVADPFLNAMGMTEWAYKIATGENPTKPRK